MPHLLGVELHGDGIAVAALRPDQTIALRPVDDLARVMARAGGTWKWSLGDEAHDGDAAAAVIEVFAALRYALGNDEVSAAISVPAAWDDRARRSLLHALESAGVEVVQLVRDTTALGIGAMLLDPTVQGFCAVIDLGSHHCEAAVAELALGTVHVLARSSVVGVEAWPSDPAAAFARVEALGLELTREAGLALVEITHLLVRGARFADPAWAERLRTIWGVAPTLLPRGVAAMGAAHVAVGLSGGYRPWDLRDDLAEPPLSALRGGAPGHARVSIAAPPPAEEISIPAEFAVIDGSTARPPAPPEPDPAETESASLFEEAGRVSEIPSYVPPAEPMGVVTTGGSFVGLTSLDEVRALSLVQPVGAEGLESPLLATLLNQFVFMREVSGLLVLRRRGERDVSIPIERGGPCLTHGERARALQAFEWPDGLYSWQRQTFTWDVQKLRLPMTAFISAGLRARLRHFDPRDFARAHAARLPLSPVVIDDRRPRLARLGLAESEMRAVEHILDGTRSFESMLGEGFIGRGSLHQLVAILDVYGILQWVRPTVAAGGNPGEAMKRRAREIQGANYFEVLEVHWSATLDEIRASWEKMRTRYAPGGAMHQADPELADRILRRCASAWTVLSDHGTRARHRRESYPDIDEELLATLIEDRANALSMRGDKRSAVAMMQLRGEFHVKEAPTDPLKPRR